MRVLLTWFDAHHAREIHRDNSGDVGNAQLPRRDKFTTSQAALRIGFLRDGRFTSLWRVPPALPYSALSSP